MKAKQPTKKAPKKPVAVASEQERVAIAEAKVHFSRYVRQVQDGGHPITITMHCRDVAVLAPVKPAATTLSIRPRLEQRSFADMVRALGPLPDGSRPSEKDVREALDWTRADRF